MVPLRVLCSDLNYILSKIGPELLERFNRITGLIYGSTGVMVRVKWESTGGGISASDAHRIAKNVSVPWTTSVSNARLILN
jgi:hypothetical protein